LIPLAFETLDASFCGKEDEDEDEDDEHVDTQV